MASAFNRLERGMVFEFSMIDLAIKPRDKKQETTIS